MMTLIEMLALQHAQSEGREHTTQADVIWANSNIETFELLRNVMGLEVQDNDVLFDEQMSKIK